MSKKLWQPSLIVKKNSNLFAFENYISKKLKIKFNRNYKKLLNWSIENSPEFWSRFWDFLASSTPLCTPCLVLPWCSFVRILSSSSVCFLTFGVILVQEVDIWGWKLI